MLWILWSISFKSFACIIGLSIIDFLSFFGSFIYSHFLQVFHDSALYKLCLISHPVTKPWQTAKYSIPPLWIMKQSQWLYSYNLIRIIGTLLPSHDSFPDISVLNLTLQSLVYFRCIHLINGSSYLAIIFHGISHSCLGGLMNIHRLIIAWVNTNNPYTTHWSHTHTLFIALFLLWSVNI